MQRARHRGVHRRRRDRIGLGGDDDHARAREPRERERLLVVERRRDTGRSDPLAIHHHRRQRHAAQHRSRRCTASPASFLHASPRSSTHRDAVRSASSRLFPRPAGAPRPASDASAPPPAATPRRSCSRAGVGQRLGQPGGVGELLRVHHDRVGVRRVPVGEEARRQLQVAPRARLQRRHQPPVEHDPRRHQAGEDRDGNRAREGA